MFTIALLALLVIAAFIALVFGVGFLAVFCDLAICIAIIYLIYTLFKRKKKKE